MPTMEDTGLISGAGLPTGRAWRNFLIMSFGYGAAHGGVTVAIAYASSVFDISLGSYSTGIVYSMYTLTSLLIAAPIVDWIGAQKAMVFALASYLTYLLCFVIATLPSLENTAGQWACVIIGSTVGGFASGIGWVSQGVYFAKAAAHYRREEGITATAANDLFAGYFATM